MGLIATSVTGPHGLLGTLVIDLYFNVFQQCQKYAIWRKYPGTDVRMKQPDQCGAPSRRWDARRWTAAYAESLRGMPDACGSVMQLRAVVYCCGSLHLGDTTLFLASTKLYFPMYLVSPVTYANAHSIIVRTDLLEGYTSTSIRGI